jgi:hypothetical protein
MVRRLVIVCLQPAWATQVSRRCLDATFIRSSGRSDGVNGIEWDVGDNAAIKVEWV